MRTKLLKEKRTALGMSTTQLAHRLGVAQSTVVRLEQSEERGTISLESLQRVAGALGCSLTYDLKPLPGYTANRDARKVVNVRGRKFSPLAEDLRTRETILVRASSPSQRFKRGIELSDFARRLRCSNMS